MSDCVVAILLALTLIVLAKLLFDRFVVGRMMVWLVALAAYAVMHFVSLEQSALMRMVLLCSVLMAGMKWIVYSEWRRTGGRVLPWGRWLCFTTLWFGMEPMAWIGKRRKLQWKNHALVGGACCLTGGVVVFLMSYYEVAQLLPLFLAMSVGFHFGVLRLLTAFWRLQGFPVKTLFRNPFVTRGFEDFWSRRWNLAYSQMMARAVKRPLQKVIGARGATFSVFVTSGLLHELAITVPVQAGYGLPTGFFIAQGFFTTFENRLGLANGLLCGLSLVIGVHFLFPAAFVEAVILPARDVFNLFIL